MKVKSYRSRILDRAAIEPDRLKSQFYCLKSSRARNIETRRDMIGAG